MPQPYDYTVAQPDVGTYFQAMKAGREDRAVQQEQERSSALQKYLPQALEGDSEARTQAMGIASPEQMIQLKNTFMSMDAKQLEDLRAKQGQAAAIAFAANTPEKWAMANAQIKQLMPNAPDLPFEQREFIIAKGQSISEMLKQAHDEKMLANDTLRAKASATASYAAADASRRSGVGFGAPGTIGGRPLPASVQTKEDADIEALQGARTIQQKTQGWIDQFKKKDGLVTGPVSQLARQFGRYTGLNTDNSRALNLFNSDLEGMRNDSLRLNSGVQTEGDAQREWRALLDNVNDQEYVVQALGRINQLNKRAEALKMQSINIRRARNGAQPLDPSQLDVGDAGTINYASGQSDDFSDVDALLGLK